MPTTLKDIAEACAIDMSTVSRAIRGDSRVKLQTRERICAKAKEMGYFANVAARTLAGAKTQTIWLLVRNFNNGFDQNIAELTSRSLSKVGYDISLMSYHNSPERYQYLLSRLSQGVCDGAIVIPTTYMGYEDELLKLNKKGFPLVFLDREPSFSKHTIVTTDNKKGVQGLIELLQKEGATKFVVLYGQYNSAEEKRLKGAIQYLDEKKVPYVTQENLKEGYITGNDKIGILSTASGTIVKNMEPYKKVMKSKNTVIGLFDDGLNSNFPASKVYVCIQDFEKLSKKAAELIVDLIAGKKQSRSNHTVLAKEYYKAR